MASAVWTPSGGAAATLGDDAAKYFMSFGFEFDSIEQVDQLAMSNTVLRIPRGNKSGQLTLTVIHSYATLAACAAAIRTEALRRAAKGQLVMTIDTTTLTFANSTLTKVQPVPQGVKLTTTYIFGLTDIS